MKRACPVCDYTIAKRVKRMVLLKLLLPASRKYKCGHCRSTYVAFGEHTFVVKRSNIQTIPDQESKLYHQNTTL